MAPPAKPLSSRPLFTALPRHAGAAAPASATLLDLATVACNVRATPFPRIRFTGGAAPRAPKRARPEQTMEASAKRARVCGEEEDAAQSSGGEEQEEPRNEDEEPRKEEESNKEEEESRKEQRSASLEEENARLRRENEAMRRRLALVYAVMRSDASFAAARQRLTAAAQ